MAKHLISTDNTTYLQECGKEIYIQIPSIFLLCLKDYPQIENLKSLVDSMGPGGWRYTSSIDYGLEDIHGRKQHIMMQSYIVVPYLEKRPTINIGPKHRASKKKKSEWENFHSNLSQYIVSVQQAIEFLDKGGNIEPPDKFTSIIDQKLLRSGLKNIAEKIYEAIASMELGHIDFSDYKFKTYVDDNLEIDTVSPYYLFEEGGNFLALTRKRGSRAIYEWSLSPTMTHAYLFTQPQDSYDIPHWVYTRVEADIKIKGVVGPDKHPKIQEIQSRIEKRDLGEMIVTNPKKKAVKL